MVGIKGLLSKCVRRFDDYNAINIIILIILLLIFLPTQQKCNGPIVIPICSNILSSYDRYNGWVPHILIQPWNTLIKYHFSSKTWHLADESRDSSDESRLSSDEFANLVDESQFSSPRTSIFVGPTSIFVRPTSIFVKPTMTLVDEQWLSYPRKPSFVKKFKFF